MAAPETNFSELNATEREQEALLELRGFTAESAYGFTPKMAFTISEMLVQEDPTPYPLIVGTIAAVGNIKENMDTNEILRQLQDIFDLSTTDKKTRRPSVNFSAVRMVGMIFCYKLADDIPVIKRISEKHGNPFSGDKFPDTEGGRINKELYETFEKDEWKAAFEIPNKAKHVKALKNFYGSAGGFTKEAVKSIKDNLTKSSEQRRRDIKPIPPVPAKPTGAVSSTPPAPLS
jgi:hypothetical protein